MRIKVQPMDSIYKQSFKFDLTEFSPGVNVELEGQDGARMRTPERSIELTQVTEWDDGDVRSVQDSLAAEEPLEILSLIHI